SAVLLGFAPIPAGAHGGFDPGLLDCGARLAIAISRFGATRDARDRSPDFPPGRRSRIAVSARRAGGGTDSSRAAILSGPLRDGAEPAQFAGWRGLRGQLYRAAAAVAADRRVRGGSGL